MTQPWSQKDWRQTVGRGERRQRQTERGLQHDSYLLIFIFNPIGHIWWPELCNKPFFSTIYKASSKTWLISHGGGHRVRAVDKNPSFCICPLQTRQNFSITDDNSLLMISSLSKGHFPHWGPSHSHRRLQRREADSCALSHCVQNEPCQAYHQHILTLLSTGPPFIPCFHSPSPQKCGLFAAKTEKRGLKQKSFLCNTQAPATVNKAR